MAFQSQVPSRNVDLKDLPDMLRRDMAHPAQKKMRWPIAMLKRKKPPGFTR
jgi:hypothetical protein